MYKYTEENDDNCQSTELGFLYIIKKFTDFKDRSLNNSDALWSLCLDPDAIDDPNVSYTAAVVDNEDSGSEQVPIVDSTDMVAQQHVALVTQEDGTQQQVRIILIKRSVLHKLTFSVSLRLLFNKGERKCSN